MVSTELTILEISNPPPHIGALTLDFWELSGTYTITLQYVITPIKWLPGCCGGSVRSRVDKGGGLISGNNPFPQIHNSILSHVIIRSDQIDMRRSHKSSSACDHGHNLD